MGSVEEGVTERRAGEVEAAEHVRLILQTANDAFIGIDEAGAVIDWNRQAELLFGWRADEALGAPLAELVIPPGLRDAHHAGLRRFLDTGEGRVVFERLELPAIDRHGRRLDVELTIWPSRADGRWRFNAFLRDVTSLRRERSFLSVIGDVTRAANAAFEPDPVVRLALERVCELTGWPLGHAWRVLDDHLEPTGWWHRAEPGFEAFVDATMATTFAIGAGLPGRVAASGQPSWIIDVRADPDFPRRRAAAADDLHSAVAFPVLVRDQVVAVLEFLTTDRYADDPRLATLMADVGVQVGRVYERRAALERERASAEFRTRMLSVLSHDLRSPASAIRSFADLLEHDWDTLDRAGALDVVARVRRQADRIVTLVGELLTVQRLDAGAVTASPEDVDVRASLDQVVEDLGLAEEVTVTASTQARAHVDPDHLDRMLTNLLANARRHGQPPVEVLVSLEDDQCVVVVRDHGPGLPASMEGRVFQPFATPARASGTGLGLSIVDGLARQNRGEVVYVSGSSPGATFELRLPVA